MWSVIGQWFEDEVVSEVKRILQVIVVLRVSKRRQRLFDRAGLGQCPPRGVLRQLIGRPVPESESSEYESSNSRSSARYHRGCND